MTGITSKPLTRRSILAGLSASVLTKAALADSGQVANADVSPSFSLTGPDAARYGAADGYPASIPWRLYQPGDPDRYRVGAYNRFETIHPTSRVARAASMSTFRRAPLDLRYAILGVPSTLEDCLARNPITGLLVTQDDRILFQRYQYGRTDADRFNSGSMAKSITGLMVGIAVGEGAVRSVDDPAEAYVPGFAGTEYERTPIRDLLHPKSWMLDATTIRPTDGFLASRRATHRMGYGCLLWLFPGPRRQFAFRGDPGQRILVDPGSKLTLVQTAVGRTDETWDLWSSLSAQFGGS